MFPRQQHIDRLHSDLRGLNDKRYVSHIADLSKCTDVMWFHKKPSISGYFLFYFFFLQIFNVIIT